MDVNAIVDGIIERKEQVGMTYQQITDASGVPKTTVIRILTRQTQNPSIKNVADIAVAVGYDIDPVQPADLKDYTKDAYIVYLQEALEAEKKIADKRIAEQRAHYTMLRAEDRREKNRLTIAIIALVSLLIGWLMIDVLHPTAGWIQRELARYAEYNAGPFGNMLYTIQEWIQNI